MAETDTAMRQVDWRRLAASLALTAAIWRLSDLGLSYLLAAL